MSSIFNNSIWPSNGVIGSEQMQIPDGINTKWPEGDSLVGNFVFKNGKLVGLVDTKSLVINDSKSTTIPYNYANADFPNILKDTMTITGGERCKNLIISCFEDAAVYITPMLKEILGDAKFITEFIKEENKLIVHTDRLDDEKLVTVSELLERVLPQNMEVVRYNHNMEISWRDINKYAACKTVDDMTAVNPDFRNDITSDGEWVYPLPLITWLYHIFPSQKNLKKWSGALPKLYNAYACFMDNSLIEWNLDLPSLGNSQHMFNETRGRVFKYKGKLPNLVDGSIMFNTTVLESFMEELPKLSKGESMFLYSRLDKESVLTICGSIPAYTSGTHKLSLGIHIDHQNDEDVLAAIANAESKGWTLAVAWNGTPTTQTTTTFGLRRPVYAKLGHLENPDGVTEQYLDWGHYVTDPTDYQEFSSLEEAYSHFGLPQD